MKKTQGRIRKSPAGRKTLRERLEEAEETLRAIRDGGVDALVIAGPRGDQVFALKGAEHPYRIFVEAMQEGAATLGPDGTILYGNNRLAEMGRRAIGKLIGASVFELFGPADLPAFKALFEQGREKNAWRELHFIRADRDPLPVSLSLSPLPAGETAAVCLVAQDLTERIKAEQASRILAIGLEQSGDSLAIMDRLGVVSRVNSAFERLNACTKEEILGQSYAAFLAVRGVPESTVAQVREALALGKAWSGRMTRKLEASSRELEVTLNPIRDASGDILSYFAVGRDITRDILFQRGLRQRQKMEALGTLAGGIAHDLNNILAPIMANTELALLDASEAAPTRDYLRTSLQAVIRGKDLVKRILTFSALSEPDFKPTKLGPIVQESLKLLRASLPVNIQIRENVPDLPETILADPTQIQEIILNLAGNAVEAMRDHGGTLEINLKKVEIDGDQVEGRAGLLPGPYLLLTVSDTGRGMPPEVMEKIFDPFFTTKNRGEGTGMGLAIVQGIVKAHGGAVTVYSEVGQGTIFHVYLPPARVEEGPPEKEPEKIATGQERILFVDDEEIQTRTAQRMLERLGYKVTTRTDPLEALTLFLEDPGAFDLVITDQTMPRLAGAVLAGKLLAIRPDLPIILCTGFSETIDEKAASAMGILGYLMKPYMVRELADAIRRALDKSSG